MGGEKNKKSSAIVSQEPEETFYEFNKIVIPLDQVVEICVDHKTGLQLQSIADDITTKG